MAPVDRGEGCKGLQPQAYSPSNDYVRDKSIYSIKKGFYS